MDLFDELDLGSLDLDDDPNFVAEDVDWGSDDDDADGKLLMKANNLDTRGPVAEMSPLTYHVNNLSFFRQHLNEAKWKCAAEGEIADFSMWIEKPSYALARGDYGNEPNVDAKNNKNENHNNENKNNDSHSKNMIKMRSLATGETPGRKARLSLYPRATLELMNNKVLLCRYLRRHGLDGGGEQDSLLTSSYNGVPITFLTIAEMNHWLAKGDNNVNPLLFLKGSMVEASLGVWCFLSASDLIAGVETNGMAEGTYVIQVEVPNLALIDERKFSIRAYLVVWGNEFWLASEFMVKVHKHRYDRTSVSKKVHVESRAADASVNALKGSSMPQYQSQLDEMCRLIKQKFGPFSASLPQSQPQPTSTTSVSGDQGNFDLGHGQFALFGADFLFDAAGKGWLIEFNYSPCLFDTAAFTNSIKSDLALNICNTFVIAAATSGTHDAYDSQHFVQCL